MQKFIALKTYAISNRDEVFDLQNTPCVEEIWRDIPSTFEKDKYWNVANSYYFKCIACAMQLAEVRNQSCQLVK